MRIIGFEKLTLVDYPAKVACILFCGGCNMRCPYCHNGELVLHPDYFPPFSDDEIFSYLKKRKGILDAVVISGGEPTLQEGLGEYMARIKDEGLLVKLDTNGTRPDVIRSLIDDHLVDYIAMDVKNSIDSYAATVGIKGFNPTSVMESITLLKEGRVDYEFRTTVTKETHKQENFIALASLLEGAKAYYLQNYVPNENTIEKGNTPLSYDELQNYIRILRKTIGNVKIRNI